MRAVFAAALSLFLLMAWIATSDSRNRKMAGFETLFYEASHALAGGLLLLYTATEQIGRASSNSREGNAASKTALRETGNRLNDRGWGDYALPIERYWQPYLNGQIDLDTAVAHLINGI